MQTTMGWVAAAVTAGVVTLGSMSADASWPWVTGNGEAKTEVRKLEGFDQVKGKGSVDVWISEGEAFRVQVKADSNLLAQIQTQLDGRTLLVDTQGSYRTKTPMEVRVWLPKLRQASAMGSGDLHIEGSQRERELQLATSGSGDVRYHGPAKHLTVSSNGSGDLELSLSTPVEHVALATSGSGDTTLTGPHVQKLEVKSSGSGEVLAKDLPAHSAVLVSNGSGDVQATLEGGTLEVRASGSGDVQWWGKADVTRRSAVGSGDITHR